MEEVRVRTHDDVTGSGHGMSPGVLAALLTRVIVEHRGRRVPIANGAPPVGVRARRAGPYAFVVRVERSSRTVATTAEAAPALVTSDSNPERNL
ncbi:hypothetical protein AB0I91_43815 [Actinosynnema sp. NPDC049800]